MLLQAPMPVAAGGSLIYTLSFANLGNTDATNVVLEDVLPSAVVFVSATDGGVFAGGSVTWTLGTVAAGTGGSVSLTVDVNSPLPDGISLVNAATLQSSETPPISAQASTRVTSTPMLSLTKTANINPVAAGGQLLYTLGYANLGTDVASAVTLSDALPAQTSFVTASGGGSFDPMTGIVTWNLGTLAPGESGLVTLTVQVTSPLASGTSLLNVATLVSAETQPLSATAVTTVASVGALTLSKSAAPSAVNAGGQLTYTLSYANPGTDAVTNTYLIDTLPSPVTFLSASGGGTYAPATSTVTWSLGTLAAGTGGSVTVTIGVPAPIASGTILVNSAVLSGDGVTSASASAQTPVNVPILGLEKTAIPSSVEVGGVVLFELHYENTGNAPASGVVLVDTLPLGTDLVSVSDGGVFDPVGITVTWSLGTLVPGASGIVALELRILELMDPLLNTARLSALEALPVQASAEVAVSQVTVEIPALSPLGLVLLSGLLALSGLSGLWLHRSRSRALEARASQSHRSSV